MNQSLTMEEIAEQKKLLTKALNELTEMETAIRKEYHMYEDAGCSKCGKSGYTLEDAFGGGGFAPAYNKKRCECTRKHTKKFANFIANKGDMLVKDYEEEMKKYYDNNAYCDSERYTDDRSW